MNYNYKVSIDFSTNRYSDPALSRKVGTIIELMTGNPSFPTPAPTLEQVSTALAEFTSAMDKTAIGGPPQTVIKNQKRDALVALLKTLAEYVQLASNGDEGVILSSGYSVNKRPTPIGPLQKATGFTVMPGTNHGSVELSCNVIKGANSYIFEYTPTPILDESIWIKEISTKHKLQLEHLKRGVEFAFRVAGAGADPSRNWSEPVLSYVL